MRRYSINVFLLAMVIAWMQLSYAVLLLSADMESGLQPARILPDYSEIVIPPNIAPMNFVVKNQGKRYRVKLSSAIGKPIEASSRNGNIVIPIKLWSELLRANKGQRLIIETSILGDNGQWQQCIPITNSIANYEIDSYLVYRLLRPLYNIYRDVGIYQRNLENYVEQPILKNTMFDRGCLNCHTFLNNHCNQMALNIRTENHGRPMLLVKDNEVININKTAGYLSWHPSGDLLTFSVNKLSLFFHTMGENRDVFDAKSDLGVYDFKNNKVIMPKNIGEPDRLETWPAWAPDGKHLYFCSAKPLSIEQFKQVRYDLMRISYNHTSRAWGEAETLLSADEIGFSMAQPKVSPDGKYLLFCMFAYGNFPIYQKNSDLYMMDLETKKHRRLDINSDESESWHCWSRNSRWIVFSSKRRDGVFARPHFSYVDELGTVHKPFILPQKDPTFYDSYIKTFNVPELVCEPVRISQKDFARAILNPRKILTPETASPRSETSEEQYTPSKSKELELPE